MRAGGLISGGCTLRCGGRASVPMHASAGSVATKTPARLLLVRFTEVTGGSGVLQHASRAAAMQCATQASQQGPGTASEAPQRLWQRHTPSSHSSPAHSAWHAPLHSPCPHSQPRLSVAHLPLLLQPQPLPAGLAAAPIGLPWWHQVGHKGISICREYSARLTQLGAQHSGRKTW